MTLEMVLVSNGPRQDVLTGRVWDPAGRPVTNGPGDAEGLSLPALFDVVARPDALFGHPARDQRPEPVEMFRPGFGPPAADDGRPLPAPALFAAPAEDAVHGDGQGLPLPALFASPARR